MEPRPAAGLIVSALVRRVGAEGGHAAVLARGDPDAGALLVQLACRGVAGDLLERRLGAGGYQWAAVSLRDGADAYVARRRRDDSDLWVVELDHPDARAILAEVAP